MIIKINFPSGYNVKNELNDNIDINIILDNGDVYFLTLFTILNIEEQISKYSSNYFWSSDMLIVSDLKINSIKNIIKEIFHDELLENHFTIIGNKEQIFGDPQRYGETIEIYLS